MSASRTAVKACMWKRALNPLPTNPMRRGGWDMEEGERERVRGEKGASAAEGAVGGVDLAVFHAELRERGVGAAVPARQHPFPMYCRSSIPIFVDQNPDAVRSRKRLKNATPGRMASVALAG